MKLYLIIALLVVIMGTPSISSNASYETITDYNLTYCEKSNKPRYVTWSCNYPKEATVLLDSLPPTTRLSLRLELYGGKKIELSLTRATILDSFLNIAISNCPEVTFRIDFTKESFVNINSLRHKLQLNNIENVTVNINTGTSLLYDRFVKAIFVRGTHATTINIHHTQIFTVINSTIDHLNVSIIIPNEEFKEAVSFCTNSTIKYVDFLRTSHDSELRIKNCSFGPVQPHNGLGQEIIYITNNLWPSIAIVTPITIGVTLLLACVVFHKWEKVMAFLTGCSLNNHSSSADRDNTGGVELETCPRQRKSKTHQSRNIQREIEDDVYEAIDIPPHEDTIYEEINIPPHEDTIYEEIDIPPHEDTIYEGIDIPPHEDTTYQNVVDHYIYEDILIEKGT